MSYTIFDIPDLARSSQRIAAFDIGTKTIGLALATAGFSVITPYKTLRRSKYTHDIQYLRQFISEYDIAVIVIGLPLNMDGTAGAKVQSIKTIGANLGRDLECPIVYQDERLSTFVAERRLLELDVSRTKRAKIIDSHAACVILESVAFDLQTA